MGLVHLSIEVPSTPPLSEADIGCHQATEERDKAFPVVARVRTTTSLVHVWPSVEQSPISTVESGDVNVEGNCECHPQKVNRSFTVDK